MIRNALLTRQASFVLRACAIALQLGWKVLAGRDRQGGKSLAEVGFYRGRVGGDPKLSVFPCCVPTIASEKDSAGLHHRLCSEAL